MAADGTWLALGTTAALVATTLVRGSRAKVPKRESIQVEIDLKYVLWEGAMDNPRDADQRRDRAAMRAAVAGTGPEVIVLSNPGKENNYGWVRLFEGGAEVRFWYPLEGAEDLFSLMESSGVNDLPAEAREHADADLTAWFEEHAGFGPHGQPLGARVHETIHDRSFPRLMVAIAVLDRKAGIVNESSSAELYAFITRKKIPRITGERWK